MESKSKRMMKKENEKARGEYVRSETMVWWDINNCPIPNGVDPGLVGPIIQSALRKLGYNGPLTIKAIGNLNLIPKETLRELSTSGIALRHAKNRLVSVIVDMGRWRHENPGKVSIMLISNASSVRLLSASIADKKANTLLAYPITPSRLNPRLEPSAQWLWHSLLNDGLVPDATTPLVVAASSAAMFYCVPCSFDCQSFRVFADHIYAQGHSEILEFSTTISGYCRANLRWSKKLKKNQGVSFI